MNDRSPSAQGPGTRQVPAGGRTGTPRHPCPRCLRRTGPSAGCAQGSAHRAGGRGPSPQLTGALKAAGPLLSTPEPVPWCDVKNRFESESGHTGWRGGPGPQQVAVVTEKAQGLGGSRGEEVIGALWSPPTQTVCERMRLADTGVEGRADHEVGPSAGTEKSLVWGGQGLRGLVPERAAEAAPPSCQGVRPLDQTAFHLPVTRVPSDPHPGSRVVS